MTQARLPNSFRARFCSICLLRSGVGFHLSAVADVRVRCRFKSKPQSKESPGYEEHTGILFGAKVKEQTKGGYKVNVEFGILFKDPIDESTMHSNPSAAKKHPSAVDLTRPALLPMQQREWKVFTGASFTMTCYYNWDAEGRYACDKPYVKDFYIGTEVQMVPGDDNSWKAMDAIFPRGVRNMSDSSLIDVYLKNPDSYLPKRNESLVEYCQAYSSTNFESGGSRRKFMGRGTHKASDNRPAKEPKKAKKATKPKAAKAKSTAPKRRKHAAKPTKAKRRRRDEESDSDEEEDEKVELALNDDDSNEHSSGEEEVEEKKEPKKAKKPISISMLPPIIIPTHVAQATEPIAMLHLPPPIVIPTQAMETQAMETQAMDALETTQNSLPLPPLIMGGNMDISPPLSPLMFDIDHKIDATQDMLTSGNEDALDATIFGDTFGLGTFAMLNQEANRDLEFGLPPPSIVKFDEEQLPPPTQYAFEFSDM